MGALLVLVAKSRDFVERTYSTYSRRHSTRVREASMSITRRAFLNHAASSVVAAASGGSAFAAMGPDDKFDLMIKGGDVLDPSQSLRGKRDIGIRWGTVEAIEAEIPAARALNTIDVSGTLVLPGLVDLHCQVYPYGSAIGIPA